MTISRRNTNFITMLEHRSSHSQASVLPGSIPGLLNFYPVTVNLISNGISKVSEKMSGYQGR